MKTIFGIFALVLCLAPTALSAQQDQKKTLSATESQYQAFLGFPDDQPLLMVNFVKFKDKVGSETGKEVYERYIKGSQPFADKIGAEVVWYGKPLYNLVGPEDGVLWDAMFVVKYKNKNAFFQLVQSQEVPHDLRVKAVDNTRMIACSPQDNFFKR